MKDGTVGQQIATLSAALAAAMKPPVKPQRDEQAYQSYRAGERNAEAIVAEYQAQHAYQSYRAGERASYEPASQPKSLWQRAGEWLKSTFTPQPVPPPTPPTTTGTPTPSIRATPTATATPKPIAAPTIIPTVTPAPPTPQAAQGKKPWWLSPALEDAAKTLVQTIPSAKIGSWRNPSPAFSWVAPGHVISFGRVSSGMLASDANPNLTLNPDGSLTPSVGRQPIASLTPRPDGFDFNLRNPWQRHEFAEGTIKATLSSSVTARVTWGGFWNTTVGIDINYPEVQVSGAGMKGRVSDGWYVEYKPGKLVTYVVGAQLVFGSIVAGVLLAPSISIALAPVVQPVYEMIKQFLTQFKPGIP